MWIVKHQFHMHGVTICYILIANSYLVAQSDAHYIVQCKFTIDMLLFANVEVKLNSVRT